MDFSDAVSVFGRHMVGLELARYGTRKIYSAFVASFFGRYALFTAGHIIGPLQRAKIPTGAIASALHDASGSPKFQCPLPYHFDADEWIVLGEQEGEFDCAFAELSPIVAGRLISGDVVPLNSPDCWWTASMPADGFILAGIPDGFCNPDAGEFSVTAHALRLTTKPANATEPFVEPLYFDVSMDAELPSMKGMSGGPVFALRKDSNAGKLYTRWVGVQSGWFPGPRVVWVSPVSRLVEQLQTWVDANS